jgi:hypothetical protein
MDGLTLLRRAYEAGLRVEAAGNNLLIHGPRRAEPVVRLLAEHKAVVLEALAATAMPVDELNVLPPSPWFERTVPAADGEPRLDESCISRRGRVHELDRAVLHFCIECGAYGAFGYGVNPRSERFGNWFCAAHRPRGRAT